MAESVKQAITAELRLLRREPGPLTASKLTSAPVIVKGLGGDEPDVALDRLLQLGIDHEDEDIAAALFVMGHGATQASVADRHNEWAALHPMDERNVRRVVDSGIDKLVRLIVGLSPWVQPVITETLRQQGDLVTVKFRLELPPKVAMRLPDIYFNGDEQDVAFDRVPGAEGRVYASKYLGALDSTAHQSTIRLWWRGERAPEYRLVTGPRIEAEARMRMMRFEMWTFLSAIRAH